MDNDINLFCIAFKTWRTWLIGNKAAIEHYQSICEMTLNIDR